MRACTLVILMLLAASGTALAQEWDHIGGDAGGLRYSPLDQINRDNVADLELAWTYRTGDADRPQPQKMFSGFHPTPILLPEEAGRSLVICSAFNKIIALDPVTGEERWAFDAEINIGAFGTQYKCRGVAKWKDTKADINDLCAWRIYMTTNDRRVFAVDARTGQPCYFFGDKGQINLTPLIDAALPATNTPAVQMYVPPTFVGDVFVVGLTTNTKAQRTDAPNGSVRAFDARSGNLVWAWDPIPRGTDRPEELGWTKEALANTGGANVWTFMAADEARDLIFLPTSSASPDFYGGTRPGDNLYSDSLVALRGSTGELVWYYQIVHHDIWNFDLPAQPILADVERDGRKIPIVIQLTKQGLVFAFHRESGEPFFPIIETPVPTDGAPGEVLSPTQPIPSAPPPLIRQYVTPEDAWGFTPYDKGWCRKQIEQARHGDIYVPLSTQGTILPQSGGGSNWGGGAYEPTRNLLVTTVAQAPFYFKMVPLVGAPETKERGPFAPKAIAGVPYLVERKPFLSPFGAPCTEPPWGKLVAVDMDTGTIAWDVAIGEIDKLSPIPLKWKLGTPVMGGPIVTGGGLVFVGATMDERFRAFDIETGEELWRTDVPSAAVANPMTYEIDGRQFIVTAAPGHFYLYPQKISDHLVAFALPVN